jgi:hypothetical protein
VAQRECVTSGCNRVGQISGVLIGLCCSLCGVTDPQQHAHICNMIEEAGRAEIQEDDKTVVLGYN